jgi:ketosteroid isomerase-like protein
MIQKINRIITLLAILFVCFGGTISAQKTRERKIPDWCDPQSGLNGLYRIDFERSDRLYSVIEGASSNIPFGEQQQFFIDLSVRLAPPDLLAIECREKRISLASSRASKVDFSADGVTRNVRSALGDSMRTRIWFDSNGLVFTSSGGSNDNLNFNFVPIDGGKALRVTRRISAKELIEPVIIQTIYNKIAGVARWDIFDDSQIADRTANQTRKKNSSDPTSRVSSKDSAAQNDAADELRETLAQWIAATNRRDIEKQMSFYMSELKAFYLTRNASINSVRTEKNRAFAAAKSINISAAEPEIIFQNGGREAIMRFRKVYDIQNIAKSRRGEVIQELRWQQTNRGWKIFSERDIKVIR